MNRIEPNSVTTDMTCSCDQVTHFGCGNGAGLQGLVSMDTVFVRCRGYDWRSAQTWLGKNGIAAVFSESCVSVARKVRSLSDESPPTEWHVTIPLSQRITAPPVGSPDRTPWLADLERSLWYVTGAFAALFGLPLGCENKPGLELAMSICLVRRAVEGGPVPQIVQVHGDKAIDYMKFLSETGFTWKTERSAS